MLAAGFGLNPNVATFIFTIGNILLFDTNYRYELFKAYLYLIGRLDRKYVSNLMEGIL